MNDQLVQECEESKAKGRIWGGVPLESIRRILAFSDVLETLGIRATVPASYLRPLISSAKIAGTAITLRSIPERKTQGYIRLATRDTHYYLAESGASARKYRPIAALLGYCRTHPGRPHDLPTILVGMTFDGDVIVGLKLSLLKLLLRFSCSGELKEPLVDSPLAVLHIHEQRGTSRGVRRKNLRQT